MASAREMAGTSETYLFNESLHFLTVRSNNQWSQKCVTIDDRFKHCDSLKSIQQHHDQLKLPV